MSGAGQFRFDPGLCTGCEACVLACRMEHRQDQALPWRRVHTFNALHFPGLPVFHLSLACHHCRDAACLEHCPAGAYRRDPATGAVIHLGERCMGCRYCTWVCPYDAPRFDPGKGSVEKCDFCQGRQEQGRTPACAARCPVGALGFEPRGDGAEPRDRPPGFPSYGLGPAIRIVPGLRPPPAVTAAPDPGLLARCRRGLLRVPEPRITARGEWSLVAFTSALAVLVALTTAGAAGAEPFPLHPWLVLWTGAVCLSLGAWHLGRPDRGWRVLWNLRRSWLSREAALVLAYLGLAAVGRAGFPQSRALAWAAAGAGFAALFAVDRVYQVAVRTSRLDFHSAHVLLNGLYLTGLLARIWPLALAAGALKAGLYLHRKAHFRRRGRGVRPVLSALRLGLGFVLPVLAFGGMGAAAGAVAGDLVDRWEFYGELEIPSPAANLAEDLEACSR